MSNRNRFINISSLLILLMLIYAAPAFAGGRLTVSFIDVGQGDSAFVRFPNGQDMLIDAGDKEHGQAVVNYLRSLKISRIDLLVATHPHEDHIGGMADVLSRFKIGKVWDSGYNQGSYTQKIFLQSIKAKKIRYGTPRSGFSEKIGGVKVDVLAPRCLLSGTDSDANNNSLVLRITYGKVSFLFTGDMESEERAAVSSWPKSAVLKVAHHGSRNGTSLKFLKYVSPKEAVISVAAHNDYGHPHAETLTALKQTKAKVFKTSTSGTVVISTNGNDLTTKTAKTSIAAIKTKQPAGKRYIGNRKSHIFHSLSCSSLPKNSNRIYFALRSKAISSGYRPCKRCRP